MVVRDGVKEAGSSKGVTAEGRYILKREMV
jgi:hypothetical protein